MRKQPGTIGDVLPALVLEKRECSKARGCGMGFGNAVTRFRCNDGTARTVSCSRKSSCVCETGKSRSGELVMASRNPAGGAPPRLGARPARIGGVVGHESIPFFAHTPCGLHESGRRNTREIFFPPKHAVAFLTPSTFIFFFEDLPGAQSRE